MLFRSIEALKRSQAALDEKVPGENSGQTEEDRSEHEDDSKEPAVDDDDDSTKDLEASRRPVQVDESSNDSSPQDPVRQVSTTHDTALQED